MLRSETLRTLPGIVKKERGRLFLESIASRAPGPSPEDRPRCRGDCVDGPRPCPWVGCKYNLYLDVTKAGSIRYNFPHLDPHEMQESCALDVADRDPLTLSDVATRLNVTREAVRLALLRMEKKLRPLKGLL